MNEFAPPRQLRPEMAVNKSEGYSEAGDQDGLQGCRHESEEGFSVSCPGLPGCWSQGATEDEALANIQDAIREYLAAKSLCIGFSWS